MKTIDQIKYTGLHNRDSKTAGVQPMSEGETEMFLRLTMGEMRRKTSGAQVPEELMVTLRKSRTTQTITSRIEKFARCQWDEVVTFEALLFIAAQDVIENPAQCVLWAYTLLYMRAAEGEVIDMNLLAQWFPFGFPTADRYREVWDQQKGYELKVENCDNFIDRADWWDELVVVIGKTTEKSPAGSPRLPVDPGDIVEVESESDLETA